MKKIKKSRRDYFSTSRLRMTGKNTITKRQKKKEAYLSEEKVDFFAVKNKNKNTVTIYQVKDRKNDSYRKIKTYKTKTKKGDKRAYSDIKKDFIARNDKLGYIKEVYTTKDGVKTSRYEYGRYARVTTKEFFARVLVDSYKPKNPNKTVFAYGTSGYYTNDKGNKDIAIQEATDNAIRINNYKLYSDSDVDAQHIIIAEKIISYRRR